MLLAGFGTAGEWQATTTDLLKKEKTGFGGLCGVLVEHATGHVFIDLSDQGVFHSTDQGRSWKRFGKDVLKGRTETPGCFQLDPTGKTKRLLLPTVYNGPIAIGSIDGTSWRLLSPKATHVDWCAVDWTDPEMRFMLALKHESGGLLLLSRDGGKTFTETGKGHGPAWVFDNDTAVVAVVKSKDYPQAGILRTTNGGHTFHPVAELVPVALPRWHGDALYWLTSTGIVKTSDKGKTWTEVSDLKGGRYGPVFGKDSKHMFVLTGAGIVESTDGGTTWSKALPLPRTFGGVSALTWLEYDPVRDVLYLMKMGSDLYKLTRAGG
jgi:photosystem II stability/assembly factor-like uncharacterized protein